MVMQALSVAVLKRLSSALPNVDWSRSFDSTAEQQFDHFPALYQN